MKLPKAPFGPLVTISTPLTRAQNHYRFTEGMIYSQAVGNLAHPVFIPSLVDE